MSSNQEYEQDYYQRHKEVRLARARAWQRNNPHLVKAYGQKRRAKLRAEMFVVFGQRCVCCGESREEFLTIDHMEGNGQAHRKALGGAGANFLVALKRLGWPKEGIRILCMNCNWATRYLKTCPHQFQKPVV